MHEIYLEVIAIAHLKGNLSLNNHQGDKLHLHPIVE